MKTEKTTFSKVKKQYSAACSRWADLIPNKTNCILATYKQGDDIYNKQEGFTEKIHFNNPLGLVVKGRAELYEIYMTRTAVGKDDKLVYTNFPAYRPIRIMTEGELFGEFNILDKGYGFDGSSRSGETWRIAAGYKSALITKKMSNIDMLMEGNDTINGGAHHLLDKFITVDTVVAFIENKGIIKRDHSGKVIIENRPLFQELLHYAWPRAKIYRDCINSFNYVNKLRFERKAEKIITTLLGKTKEHTKRLCDLGKAKIADFRPLFVEAIYDVCNRPLRREPMFVINNGLPVDLNDKEFILTGLSLSNIVVASDFDSYKNMPFFFPVDLANYLIASYLTNSPTMEIVVSEPGETRTFEERTKEAVKILGIDAEISNLNDSSGIFSLKANNNDLYKKNKIPQTEVITRLLVDVINKLSETDRHFANEIKDMLVRKRAKKTITQTTGQPKKLNIKEYNTREYYIKIANRLLHDLIINSDSYPYDVTCISMAGYESDWQHIMMCFNKKNHD